MSASSGERLRVLFVDDETPIQNIMRIEIPRMGHDVTICEDGETAIKAIDENTFDAAILDLRMPGLSGWDVFDHLKQVSPETEIVISSGHGNMEDVLRAFREGAKNYLPKPCKLFEISNVLQQISEKRKLSNKAAALENRLEAVQGGSDLVGQTPTMKHVKTLISKIAPSDSTVLILGETGTGKELVARRIHDLSPRADAPFVPVNCGALPENLVESEFFGHRKGAFTGADKPRKGLLEVANGGTLFLDELGELDKGMQVKLLRFLESGEVRRVGDNEPFHVDVRVVCATNRHLQEMVAEGIFREDLFFRVNTFEIHLPSLRDRKDDIPDLARFLIARHQKKSTIPEDTISPESIQILKGHQWSGNVRELANALEHAVIMAEGQTIKVEHLPVSVTNAAANTQMSVINAVEPKTLREIEMDVIYRVLDKHDGDKPKTANELGIALKTLYNKLNQDQTRKAVG